MVLSTAVGSALLRCITWLDGFHNKRNKYVFKSDFMKQKLSWFYSISSLQWKSSDWLIWLLICIPLLLCHRLWSWRESQLEQNKKDDGLIDACIIFLRFLPPQEKNRTLLIVLLNSFPGIRVFVQVIYNILHVLFLCALNLTPYMVQNCPYFM